MKLTKKVIEAAESRAREHAIWDDDVSGLGVRISPKGRKTFVLKYRTLDGVQRKPSIGAFGALTVTQAREIARDMLAEVRKGGDPSRERQEGRVAPTVAEVCDRFMAEHSELHKKKSSVRNDEILIRLHIKPRIGSRKIADISFEDITELHNSMKDVPYAANRMVALMSKLLNLCEQWKLRPLNSNPCRHVKRYPERMRKRKLSQVEIQRLAKTLLEVETHADRKHRENPRVIGAIRLLMFTGMRVSEVLNLRWSEVDLEGGCIWLEDSKTGPKDISLNSAAREVLSAQPKKQDNDYIFPGRRAGRPLTDLKRPWHRIRSRARLDDMQLHDFRRTFAATAAAGGLSLYQIGQLLGHRSQQTTARYADLLQDPKRAASEQVGEMLTAVIGSSNERR